MTGRVSSSSAGRDESQFQGNFTNPTNFTNVSDLYLKRPRTSSVKGETNPNLDKTVAASNFQLYGSKGGN